MILKTITTLGQLKESGYKSKSIKQELRDNLVAHLRSNKNVFDGILGYEDTVIPDVERALLSQHNMLLLGLRGQAKTRMARQMTALLDEWVPFIKGSEIHDDPLNPISNFGKSEILLNGDDTPIEWLHRDSRYVEKLATPDVSVADLVGDVDPIKAASLKLAYSDERVIHFGLVPRSHRCIFVINELPDLQARIQVALFNMLQEKDIQIRGFKMRLPLDIQFVFTANPEDYTNRGSIVTPLKDRIESQILTHYPKSIEISKQITQQEARISTEQINVVTVHPLVHDILEQVSFEARKSEYVDSKSGVSARLTISAYENLVSNCERRAIVNGEENTNARVLDINGIIPAITGKIELVYEGEQEGPANVAKILIGKAIRSLYPAYFPNPDSYKKKKEANPYKEMIDWFTSGKYVEMILNQTDKAYASTLMEVPGLYEFAKKHQRGADSKELLLYMEFVLFALAEFSQISKNELEGGTLQFKDLMSSMFSFDDNEGEEGGYYE
ncbi:MAG: magnesium chelatase [Bacteroidia bacterium]